MVMRSLRATTFPAAGVAHVIDAAISYRKRGWCVVPVGERAKRPTLAGWPDLRLSEQEIPQVFDDRSNVGILLGEPSGGLVDVDLDCEEARDVAHDLLPPTGLIHGRRSAPASHYWYLIDDAPERTVRHQDPEGGTLCELRSTGGHTVAPPSVHTSGEAIRWAECHDPGHATRAELERALRKVAAASLLIRAGYARSHALQLVEDPSRGEIDPAALRILQPPSSRPKASGAPSRSERSQLTDDILGRAGVLEVLALLGIEREGTRFACPIADHKTNERSAPFVPDATLWHCHACGEGGSTITLVERIQRVDYQSARRWLAAALGITRDRGRVEVPEPPRPAEPWPDPIPLGQDTPPPFPTSALPDWLRDWVDAEATETQTPPDLAGMLALSACSAALQAKYRVSVRGRWTEPLNLYVVVVSAPGTRKSAVFAHVTAPVIDWETRQRESGRIDRIAAQERLKRLEAQIDRKRKQAHQEEDDEEADRATAEIARLLAQAEELREEIPPDPRLVFSDVTPERLVGVLATHGERAALFSAEGGLFEILAGRYSNKPNLDLVLQAHSGDRVSVERMGRSETLEHPHLTIGLAVQPDVIEQLGAQREFIGRGLLARFIYALPASNIGFRETRPPLMSGAVRDAFAARLTALLDLDRPSEPHTLELDDRAAQVLDVRMKSIERALRPEGEFSPITEWASKLTGQILRIAGILWVAGHAGRGSYRGTIDVETIERAVELGRYAAAHSRIAHSAVGVDPGLRGAEALLRWTRRRKVARFTVRRAHRDLHRHLRRADDVRAALDLLEERGYVMRDGAEWITRENH